MAESNNKESNDTLQKLVSNALKEQESSLNFIDQMMNQLCDSFNKERVTENSLDKDAESEAYVDYEAAQPTDSEDEVSMGDLFGDLIGNDPDFMDTTGTPEEYDEDTGEDPSEVSSADSDYKFDDDNLEDGDELDPTQNPMNSMKRKIQITQVKKTQTN
jgi:hypothetical protein